MNVLLTTILVRSGVLTHVWDLVKHLRTSGVNVSVAVIKTPYIMSALKLTDSELEKLLGPIAGVPFRFYGDRWELAGFARDVRPQLVHAHSPLCFPTSAALAVALDVPLVLTLHGATYWQRAYPQILAQACRIIAIGPEVARSAGETQRGKIRIIYNGIDVDHFVPGSSLLTAEQPLQILWYGRVNQPSSRGAAMLDQAAAALSAAGTPVRFRAAGHASGVSFTAIKQEGWVENTLPLLQQSHVVFGRGRALREAMACGCIGYLLGEGYGGRVDPSWFQSGYPSLSAAVRHGYPPAGAEALLADMALLLASSPGRIQKLRLEARQIAEEYFDAKEMVSAVCDVYRECLSAYAGREKKAALTGLPGGRAGLAAAFLKVLQSGNPGWHQKY
ncbi:MAG TPA: glycosyltransferase family 4 protein [Firmicutes bacterium]|nr:glycosyltransferase family 4 protein [Bacillota bacterium]